MVSQSIKQEEAIRIERSPWADNFFRPLIIIVMIMCLNVAVVNLVWAVNPSWPAGYFLLGMLLTTVEGIYSYRMLHHYRSQGVSMLRYRLAEMVVLILMLKLLHYASQPWAAVVAELQALWSQPSAFLSVEFYLVLTLGLAAWAAATFTIADLEALYDPYQDNRMVLDNLTERFFWGGGLLMVISGVGQWVNRAGASSLVDFQRPSLGGAVLSVLLYFMLGLILLSQVNLTRLLMRWRIQKIMVMGGLVEKWAKYGLILLAVVTIVAFVLPTRYSLGLLETAGLALQVAINVLTFLFQVLIVLLTLPIAWLLSLFGMPTPDRFDVTPPAIASAVLPEQGSAPPWVELVRSLLFWLVALAAIGYVLKSYLDDRPELVQQLKNFKLIAILLRLVRRLWALVRGLTQAGLELMPAIRRPAKDGRDSTGLAGGGSWLGLRRVSPRQRIMRYYLNILQRAGQQGAPRNQAETPYEYEPNLQQTAPDVQEEIHSLTDTFVHARYSREPFSDSQVAAVKKQWQRIKKALRGGGG